MVEAQIQVLKANVAELQKRLFGRKCERDYSSEAWEARRRRRRRKRGQQPGASGHGRQRRDTLPVEPVVVTAPPALCVCVRCGRPLELAGTVAARDRLIGGLPEQRQRQLHRMVNHSRFLLLPWVRSPHLASQVLARLVHH